MILMMAYYAVRWNATTRVTGERCASPDEAKRLCFGTVAPEMRAFLLTAKKREIAKLVRELSAKEGWR